MDVEPQKLKKFLLDTELITEKDFEKALDKSIKLNKNIGSVLVSEKLIDQEKLTKFQAYLLGTPFVDIEKENIPPEILNIIPEQIARVHNIIAFRKRENNLEVAMLDPEDLITIEFIKKTDPFLKILPRLATPEGIKSALRQYQQSLDIEFDDLVKPGEEPEAIAHVIETGQTPEKQEELARVAQELPVIKVVDTLLKHAILQGASDVHIEPLE